MANLSPWFSRCKPNLAKGTKHKTFLARIVGWILLVSKCICLWPLFNTKVSSLIVKFCFLCFRWVWPICCSSGICALPATNVTPTFLPGFENNCTGLAKTPALTGTIGMKLTPVGGKSVGNRLEPARDRTLSFHLSFEYLHSFAQQGLPSLHCYNMLSVIHCNGLRREERKDKRAVRVSVGSFSERRDVGDWSLCIGRSSMTRKWRPKSQPLAHLPWVSVVDGGPSTNEILRFHTVQTF